MGENRGKPCDGVPDGESTHGERTLPGGGLVVELSIVEISVGVHPVVGEGVYFEYGLNDHVIQFYYVYFIGICCVEVATDAGGCPRAVHHERHVDHLANHLVVYLLEGMPEVVIYRGFGSTQSYCEGQGIQDSCS